MKIDINTKMITLIGTPLSQSFAARMQNAAYRAAGLNAILVGSAEMPGRIAGATRDGFEKAWGFEAE